MVVTRDEPGRSIELHEEKISFWKNGGAGLFMFVLFSTVPVLVVANFFREPGASGHPNAWVPIAVLTLWLAVLTAFTVFLLRGSRRLAILSADRATGEWVVEEWAALTFFARRRVLPIASVVWMEVRTARVFGAAKGAVLPLQVRLGLREGGALVLPRDLQVHGLDKREEALDLAFRFANVAGLDQHRIVRDDHLEFHVEVSRTAEEGSTPVPPVSGPSEYERDQVGVPAGLPNREVRPFEPARFFSEYRVQRWDPGRDVLLTRPATPGQTLQLAAGCGVMLVFGTIGAWVASLALLLPAFLPLIFTAAGLGAYGLALLHHRRRSMRGQVRVDWGARRIAIERFGSILEIPFDQVERRTDLLAQDRGAKILLYCRSGNMSDTAARTLVGLGYRNVWHLEGGMNAWKGAGFTLIHKARK